MSARKTFTSTLLDAAMFVIFGIVFVVPFVFILLNAAKTRQEASLLRFSWPTEFQLWENLQAVMTYGNNRMLLALWNSTLLTVGSVTLIVLLSALVAFVMQRRSDRLASVVGSFMLAGLIIPPAVVPTVFFLQWVGLYKTLTGMIMVNVAYTMPFAILIFRTFMNNIPRELDEAALIDGASPLRVFFSIILPLLQPAIITVVVTSSVNIFNDFVGPLYFLPGAENVTAPLTLFSFISQFGSQFNLLFADVLVMTIIPLIIFIFFQKQLVSGMTKGAIKG
ncbi:MAG: L-arabinose transport system permease protein AraQ [Anaerolineae bacterium]|nr:L-arabinose transport system permease protein AraQ [Anaerolineae bacterium]